MFILSTVYTSSFNTFFWLIQLLTSIHLHLGLFPVKCEIVLGLYQFYFSILFDISYSHV